MRRPGAHKEAGANVSDAAEKAAAAGAVEHRMGPARHSELSGGAARAGGR